MSEFDLLFVCTGNICRSPVAHLMAQYELRERIGDDSRRFTVHSAGTHGLVGHPINPPAAASVPHLASGAFRARLLTRELVENADLVLTATRQHRSAAVTLVPRASSRVFTIREFARLVAQVDPAVLPDGDPVARARALVPAAAAKRGTAYVPAHEDDVDDPYGGPPSEFTTCAAAIAAALRGPLDAIASRHGD